MSFAKRQLSYRKSGSLLDTEDLMDETYNMSFLASNSVAEMQRSLEIRVGIESKDRILQ